MSFDPQDSLGFQCALTVKFFTRALAKRLKGSGISPAQFIALAHLVALGPVSQAELADHLSISPPSAVRLVDRMERDGWVSRQADPGDRRVKLVIPTTHAAEVWEKISAHSRAIVERAYRGIDEREIGRTRRTLERLRENLSAWSGPDDGH